jgi:hypothetical protein
MITLKQIILFPFLTLYASIASAEVCPMQIKTEQKITEPSGWESISKINTSSLNGISVYFDHPNTLREWAPDSVKKLNGKSFLTYQLPKKTKTVWVDCTYTTSNLILRKQLSSTIRRCDVVLIRNGTLIESVICK